jgi:hypothetical protein
MYINIYSHVRGNFVLHFVILIIEHSDFLLACIFEAPRTLGGDGFYRGLD